jgi:hypothetical protein
MWRRWRARARCEGSPAQICARAARRSQARCLMEAAAAGTARRSGPRARSTGAESGPHDRRARAPTLAGAVSHGAGPAPAGPLPQGTQTVRREPRRRQGETHSSPRALFERDARPWQSPPCTLPLRRGRYHVAQALRCRATATGHTRTERWEPRRRQGETCSPSRAPLGCGARPYDRCPAQAHEP